MRWRLDIVWVACGRPALAPALTPVLGCAPSQRVCTIYVFGSACTQIFLLMLCLRVCVCLVVGVLCLPRAGVPLVGPALLPHLPAPCLPTLSSHVVGRSVPHEVVCQLLMGQLAVWLCTCRLCLCLCMCHSAGHTSLFHLPTGCPSALRCCYLCMLATCVGPCMLAWVECTNIIPAVVCGLHTAVQVPLRAQGCIPVLLFPVRWLCDGPWPQQVVVPVWRRLFCEHTCCVCVC